MSRVAKHRERFLVMVDPDPNVFRSLGFDDRESQELRRKSDLMMELDSFIKRNRLTQARAAQILEVTQPRISDLINGRLSLFSLDELVRLCEKSGSSVEIVVRPNKALSAHIAGKTVRGGAYAVARSARKPSRRTQRLR